MAAFGSATTPTVAGAALNLANLRQSAHVQSSAACRSCVVDVPSLLLVRIQISRKLIGWGGVTPR
jgi:hypothetical protein